MATLILPDGTTSELYPKDEDGFKLEELQAMVGGEIEHLHLPNGQVMVMNEEGKLRHMPYNLKASIHAVDSGIAEEDSIVGPAVICTRREAGYSDLDLGDDDFILFSR